MCFSRNGTFLWRHGAVRIGTDLSWRTRWWRRNYLSDEVAAVDIDGKPANFCRMSHIGAIPVVSAEITPDARRDKIICSRSASSGRGSI